MLIETVSIFSKYASLMNYEPQRPHKKFRIHLDDNFDTTDQEKEQFRQEFDKIYHQKLLNKQIKTINEKHKIEKKTIKPRRIEKIE